MHKLNLHPTYLDLKRAGQPALQAWVDAGHNIQQQDQFGFALLHYAAEDGNVELAQWLLVQGADVNTPTPYGYTPLHYAARHTTAELARVLLEAGANPNAQLTQGRLCWWKPLYFAYSYESANVVALLAPRTDIPYDKTIQPHQHAIRGPYEIVQAHDSWPHPKDIQPTRRRCPNCGEKAIYNVGYTAEGGGVHADRYELFQCGNCRAKYFTLRGNLRPWKGLLNEYGFERRDPHPHDFGY